MAKPKFDKDSPQFQKRNGEPSPFLTLKDNEPLDAGITRLSKRGWVINKPVRQDGKYIYPK